MGRKLIITEKPSVARDFARVLQVSGRRNGYIENSEYVITWCVGHLVEMVYPESYDERYKKWRLEDLPFLPAEYKYDVIENVKEQYQIVHSMLQSEDIDIVYWAGDSGKEGQTIEENIRNYGGVREGMQELRVWIDSQTDDEILRGIRQARPMSDYANLGKSGIMRSIEDYALGINFSRALSVKYGRLLNNAAATKSYTAIAVGRVMTCVLGMVVIREREIRNFVETPFFRVLGSFGEAQIAGEWKAVSGSKYYESPFLYKENGFKEIEHANQFISELDGKPAILDSIEKKPVRKKAPLLYNLAELQAECSKLLKISPDETLQAAQELYERKLTTYPRTDARVLTTAVAKEIKKNINGLKHFPAFEKYADYICNNQLYRGIEKSQYTDDKKVTDHYAIVPTGQINAINSLTELQKRVYGLIVKRFLSIFYPPAEYMTVKVIFKVGEEQFSASSKVLTRLGYMEVAGVPKGQETDSSEEGSEAQKQRLMDFANQAKVGDCIEVKGYEIKEGKTAPPKRYTSGTMVLAMENAGNLIEDEDLRAQIKSCGIGTSATRAEIIKKLVSIGYLNLNKKTQVLSPEYFGEMIFEVVNLTTPSLLNPKMSASWEKGLDGITKGEVDVDSYRLKLEDYVRRETLSMVNQNLTDELTTRIHPFMSKDAKGSAIRKKLGIPCPVCGGELTTTSFGYGCSNYRNTEKPCKFSVGSIAGLSLSQEDFKQLLTSGRTRVLDGFQSKEGKSFKAALTLQLRENQAAQVNFDFAPVAPEYIEGVQCPICHSRIEKKLYGYACEKHNGQEGQCAFFISKIADRELSGEELLCLLTKGKTEVLKGFKSKKGKRFDAALQMTKDENNVINVTFDFSDVKPEVVDGIVCPDCGGKIEKRQYGFCCENYIPHTECKCNFSIGKILDKTITQQQVVELLTAKKTKTIYGFKSKQGKKFDACLILAQENGKHMVKFDFTNVEPKTIKGIHCPLCGGDIVKLPFGYGCKNHKREDPDSCSFLVGKIASVALKEADLKRLLTEKKTDVIKGFVAKTGMKFDSELILTQDGRITFAFNKELETTETSLTCPKCQKKLMKNSKYYLCDCGEKVPIMVAQKALTEEEIMELLTDGRTKHKVAGLMSKSGKPFEAFLKYEEKHVEFDFGNEFMYNEK